jgi:hypothetical protein
MKTFLFAMALAAAMGCKGKPDSENKPAPAPTPAPAPPPTATQPKPAPPEQMIKKEPPIAVAGVPTECSDYEAAIERLATCDKLDVQTRAKLRHEYNIAANMWKQMNAADKAKLVEACKGGSHAVEEAAKKPCGW